MKKILGVIFTVVCTSSTHAMLVSSTKYATLKNTQNIISLGYGSKSQQKLRKRGKNCAVKKYFCTTNNKNNDSKNSILKEDHKQLLHLKNQYSSIKNDVLTDISFIWLEGSALSVATGVFGFIGTDLYDYATEHRLNLQDYFFLTGMGGVFSLFVGGACLLIMHGDFKFKHILKKINRLREVRKQIKKEEEKFKEII